jgi:hypothetical protein
MWVPAYPGLVSCRTIILLGKATGDAAYTTLGKLGDAYMMAKMTGPDVGKSKTKSDYNAYAKRLRRELVWQVSSSRIQGSHVGETLFVL